MPDEAIRTEHVWGEFQPVSVRVGPGPDGYEIFGGEVCQVCRCAKTFTSDGVKIEYETCEETILHSVHEQ